MQRVRITCEKEQRFHWESVAEKPIWPTGQREKIVILTNVNEIARGKSVEYEETGI